MATIFFSLKNNLKAKKSEINLLIQSTSFSLQDF